MRIRPTLLLSGLIIAACSCAGGDHRPTGPAKPVSFTAEAPWLETNASYEAFFGFDQATVVNPPPPDSYRPVTVYAGKRDDSKLFLDVMYWAETRGRDEPAHADRLQLAHIDTVLVFGADHERPLAVFHRLDLTYTKESVHGFEHDGRGPVLETVERIRIPFGEHAALVRDGHPYELTIVELDDQGRTMQTQDVSGDEDRETIQPEQPYEPAW